MLSKAFQLVIMHAPFHQCPISIPLCKEEVPLSVTVTLPLCLCH